MMVAGDDLDLSRTGRAVAAAFARRLPGAPPTACVLWRDGASDLVFEGGMPQSVASALRGCSAPHLATIVRRAGHPMELAAASLPDELAPVRVALHASGYGSLALLPLFGGGEVLGCVVSLLPGGFDARDMESDPGWRLEAWGLEHLRLRATVAALHAVALLERRERVELPQGTLVVDPHGRILLADGAFGRAPEPDRERRLGAHLSEIPDGPLLLQMPVSAVPEARWTQLTLAIGPRGASVSAWVTRVAVHDAARSPCATVYLLRDVREGAPASAQLDRTLALAIRVAHMSDELRRAALLAGVRQDGAGGADPFAPTIDEAKRRLDDLLIHWGPKPLSDGLDVNTVIGETLERCRDGLAGERVKLFKFLGEDLPLVPGDRSTFQAALHVLIEGARDALRPGGGTLSVRTWVEDAWVSVAVSDDGCGRRDDSIPSWTPLFGAQGGVEEAGLEGVRRTVTAMGGRLQLERRPKVWSRATIVLPRDRRTRAVATVQPTVDSPRLAVLVVDDNAAVRSVVRRCLERRGHQVTEAENGQHALQVLAERRFDRCIVDVQMPVKSGIEFYDEVARVAPSLRERTVFMTGGLVGVEAECQITESGRPTIKKPFDLATLTQAIEA